MRSFLLLVGLMLIGICFVGIGFVYFSLDNNRREISFSVPEGTVQPPTFTAISTPTRIQTATFTYTPTLITTSKLTSTPTEWLLPPAPYSTDTATPTFPTSSPPINTATSVPDIATSSPTAISRPTLTPFPDIYIQAEWPSRLQVGTSDLVKVSIIRAGDYYVATVETPDHTAVVSSPIPLNTPVFNSGEVEYEAIIIANLVGTNFNIEPSGPIEKSLNEPNPVWLWSISPKSNVSDSQPLIVTVDVQYRHPGSSATSEKTTVWNHPLYVDVYQSLITPGQISIASLISGFLGSGFSIPWIVEQVQKRKSKPKDEKKSNK